MIKLTAEKFDLLNPTWSPNPANAGDKVTLKVEAPWVKHDQTVEFRIRRNNELIDIVEAAPGATSAKWTAPNLPGQHKLHFDAVVKEKPAAANGHLGVVAALPAPSPDLTLNGCAVAVSAIDAAFVPKQEKLNVTFRVTDAGSSAKAGRYEIWGERYPGKTPAPLYYKKFTPAANANTTWADWDGEAAEGHLSGKYITPEFSPYRLRIVVGPDAGSVADPYGEGAGKVAIAEAPFEVVAQSIWIRVQDDLKESASKDEHKLANVLTVEPPGADGDFPANQSGRLPASTEHGRIRIPMARHYRDGEALDQGGLLINQAYLEPNTPAPRGPGGAGRTKEAIDKVYYTRPEIPIEFELRLRSRVAANNTDVKKLGLFEKEAVGPAVIEPLADEFWNTSLLGPRAGGGLNLRQTYWRFAAFKVKRGTHNAPYNDGTNPDFNYWQATFDITNAATREYDASAFDSTCGFTQGSKELTVYLNRTRLVRSDRADDNELDDGTHDYRELPPAPGPLATKIRLRKDMVKVGDVLWITRIDSGAGGVAKWDHFPPGINCHVYYGGARGEAPNNLLRADYSSKAAGKEPVIGKAASFPYKEYVDEKPDKCKDEDRERVEMTAMLSGKKKGLAGVLFSPSYIAGDAYILRGWLDREGYHRAFGFVQEKPRVTGETGDLTMWRWLHVENSYRLPDTATSGLGATIGCAPEVAIGTRAYRGDGINMSLSGMNATLALAFTEWTIPKPAAGKDCHQDVPLKKYRKSHDSATRKWKGKVPLKTNADVANWFVRWDYYREFLPRRIPANRVNVASNTIAAQPVGTATATVGAAVAAAIQAYDAAGGAGDAALNHGVAAIPRMPAATNYDDWIEGNWDQAAYYILDQLTPPMNEPRYMNVIRWPQYHEPGYWLSCNASGHAATFANLVTEGFCKGSGQSFFRTAVASATLFPHEMGHSEHLVHFVGQNFAWKHHDLNQQTCYMSYTFTSGIVLQPGAPVAAGATVQNGWPQVVPNAPPPRNLAVDPSAVVGAPCIFFQAPRVPGAPCAKCLLKLRGWKEDVLPCAWPHPDLF